MNRIPEDLNRLLASYGATVIGEREIQGATQFVLRSNTEEGKLNVYANGSILEGGKESPLKEILRNYRESSGKNGKRTSPESKRSAPVETRARGSFTNPNPTPRVGTDEAGKGDYFGPLVVAGVRVRGVEQDESLRRIGVRDSKLLGLAQTRRLAQDIFSTTGEDNCFVISLSPETYDLRHANAGRNINRLLGELNAEIIAGLQDEVEVAVVDQFSEKARGYIEAGGITRVPIESRPRAEDDAAVAAASILARARYLEEMDALSEQIGFELPRGSTHVVESARRVVEESGAEGLAKVAKIHFSITNRVLDG